jgi:hypothetical protein
LLIKSVIDNFHAHNMKLWTSLSGPKVTNNKNPDALHVDNSASCQHSSCPTNFLIFKERKNRGSIQSFFSYLEGAIRSRFFTLQRVQELAPGAVFSSAGRIGLLANRNELWIENPYVFDFSF